MGTLLHPSLPNPLSCVSLWNAGLFPEFPYSDSCTNRVLDPGFATGTLATSLNLARLDFWKVQSVSINVVRWLFHANPRLKMSYFKSVCDVWELEGTDCTACNAVFRRGEHSIHHLVSWRTSGCSDETGSGLNVIEVEWMLPRDRAVKPWF